VSHCTDGVLAGFALGEPLSERDARHVELCVDCQHRLEDYRRIVLIAEGGAVTLVSPPSQVWDEVAKQAAVERTDSHLKPPANSPRTGLPRTWLAIAAAAAAGMLVGGVATSLLDGDDLIEPVVAAAELAPLPGGPAGEQSGVAELHRSGDRLVVTIAATGLADPVGFYEAWLLDPVTGGVIALGVVPQANGAVTLPIPDGTDLSVYSAVDVSDEPFDGDPAHSAVSVLRGQWVS